MRHLQNQDRPCCVPGGDSQHSTLDPTFPGQPVPQFSSTTPATADTNGLVRLDGGTFLMGSNDGLGHPADGEAPARPVTLSPFWISTRSVTNDDFATFAADTGYRTDAEEFGWSFVFHLFVTEEVRSSARRVQGAEWWVQVEGASWRQPTGPGSQPEGNHPAVHISWTDASAYADWSGNRLPTEAEWEFAARGGLEQNTYPWGNHFPTGKNARANIFEGRFPIENTEEDGYSGTAPADAYEPNDYGIFNMVGNVWEWTADWFGTNHPTDEPVDPTGPQSGTAKVMKGGSYLCHDSYCNRYRVSARTGATPDSSAGNNGFRVARDG